LPLLSPLSTPSLLLSLPPSLPPLPLANAGVDGIAAETNIAITTNIDKNFFIAYPPLYFM